MNADRAIVTISIGDRPFFADVLPSMRDYAERMGADLIVHQHSDITPSQKVWLASVPECGFAVSTKLLKFFYVRQALREYKQVLLLDDSCYISRDCPDIFSACNGSGLGAVVDGGHLGSKKKQQGKTVNTGVLVYGQQLQPFLDNIKSKVPTTGKWIADQALINSEAQSGSLEIQWLDRRFNVVGSQLNRMNEKDEKPWIYHLTSYLPAQKRVLMARKLRTDNV